MARFTKEGKNQDFINFVLNTIVLIVVLGLACSVGLLVNNGYDKYSYNKGFYEGLKSFCGDLSVGLKEGVYVCYNSSYEQYYGVPMLNNEVLLEWA